MKDTGLTITIAVLFMYIADLAGRVDDTTLMVCAYLLAAIWGVGAVIGLFQDWRYR